MHRPSKILEGLALSLTANKSQTNIKLSAAPELFGSVAPDAVVSKFLSPINIQPEVFTYGFDIMSRSLRSKVWVAAES